MFLGRIAKSRLHHANRFSVLNTRRALSSQPSMVNTSGGANPKAIGAAAVGIISMLLFASGGGSVAEQEPVATAVTEVKNPQVVEEKVCITLGVDDETVNALSERVSALEGKIARIEASNVNQAFVFIKPHAVNDKVAELVSKTFEESGIAITSQGEINHDKIDKESLVDNHYGAIAQKASVLKASEQNVNEKGQKGFEKMFGESWESVLKANKVYNAKEYCEAKGISGAELDKKWSTLSRGENMLKFGGGHYVGKLGDDYVINGFFMAMRDKYCAAPAKIHYFLVSWNPSQLSWADFREKVLGGTDPATANDGSLRKVVYQKWKELGLSAEPDVGDNGLHASASPFEAMAERNNWVGQCLKDDVFGKAALSLGISEDLLKEWMKDAQVNVEGKKQSIFDFLEDQNSEVNLIKLKEVLDANK